MTPIGLWSAEFGGRDGQALMTARVAGLERPTWRRYVYRRGATGMLLSWPSAAMRLWTDIVRGRVGPLYAVCSRSAGGLLRDVPALLAARAGRRVIVHVHGSDIVDLLGAGPLSALARWLYRPCDLVVPSAHLVAPLGRLGSFRVRVCENCLVNALPEADAAPASGLHLVWNSNIMASKGFLDVLEAVAAVRADGIEATLTVLGRPIGDRELAAGDLARRLDALGRPPWLIVPGSVANAHALRLVAAADAVLLPSRYPSECQPLSLIEAMCLGRALVVADTPALRATVAEYPAEFVPPRSVAALAEALRGLARRKRADPDGFAAERRPAAAAARQRFSPQRFEREMAAILAGDYGPQPGVAGLAGAPPAESR